MNLENRKRILFITQTAILTALVFVFTLTVNVKWPFGQGGLVHLGNVPLFIGAILLGRKSAAIAGGLGMALFDLISGWGTWAPFTLIIVALMGFAVGTIVKNRKSLAWYAIAFAASMAIKIVGYYFAELILYKNAIAPLGSIAGNVIQVGVAAFVVLVCIKPIELAVKKVGISYV